MNSYLGLMAKKHGRSGIVIDTNILLLYIIGKYNPERIEKFKRTCSYSKEEFFILKNFLSYFREKFTTPNILTEVSNFTGQIEDPMKSEVRNVFKEEISITNEKYIESVTASEDASFNSYGLADSSIFNLAKTGYLVLTDDFKLYNALIKRGVDAINFNHLRAPV